MASDPEGLRTLLAPADEGQQTARQREKAAKIAAAARGREIVKDARRAAGIPAEATQAIADSSPSDEDLYGDELYERYGDRWSF